MYFADVSSTNNFNIYKGLLDHFLERPDSNEIKILFENIIKTAHQLSTNLITESQVDNTIYNLIIAMVDYNKKYNRQYFQNIDPNSIGEKEFRTLSGILSSLLASDREFV
jgi:hypothetical protein